MMNVNEQANEYHLMPNGDFVIANYQQKKTFASFLPGIAGLHGIPLWVFYVNRGQGVASFGVADKDHAIMEFEAANKAYQRVPTQGFRTWIRTRGDGQPSVHEPFRRLRPGVRTKMIIALSSLTLEEEATDLGLKTRVEYFILPEENFGALVRKVTITNQNKTPQTLEVLDGMPVIIPYGLSNQALKEMAYTSAAWARAYGVEDKTAFYRTYAATADQAVVEKVEAGNFFIALTPVEEGTKLLTPLVDPELIFAEETSLDQPLGFFRRNLAAFDGEQITENRLPCAMAAVQRELDAGEELVLYSAFGFLPKYDLLAMVREKFQQEGYFEEKQRRVEQIHRYYTDYALTVCKDPRFSFYTRQTFMDNFLRGGFPLNLGVPGEERPYYVFSRKHGDLERDYNQFYLAPTYYSHGNGNFRDVLQNRRVDNFFNPKLKTANIKTFASLLQPDGFNPLVIEGSKYHLTTPSAKEQVLCRLSAEDRAKLEAVLGEPFTPGAVATFIMEQKIQLPTDLSAFLGRLMTAADTWTEAKFGEGYWVDHWTYLLDLIETYLALYPEDRSQLLFADHSYTFYDSYVKVQPRSRKYVLTPAGPKQTGALIVDAEKKKLIDSRKVFPYVVRKENGRGEIYRTNLFVVLFTLLLNKLSSLDPAGIGLEMEAGKPGWDDAMNGLPGLFGSSTPETMELLRLVRFLQETLAQHLKTAAPSAGVKVPTEVFAFYQGLGSLLPAAQPAPTGNGSEAALEYWTAATSLREEYREKAFLGFAGTEETIYLRDLQAFFKKALFKLENAVAQARNEETGLFNTYYTHLPVEYQPTGEASPDGLRYVEVKAFAHHHLPSFLEGQVRAMKILTTQEEKRILHQKVSQSGLYDEVLGMYRLNADLSDESFTIGRARAFSPGWLENGSIWLHMEYKYLLELLRSGLYDEFYTAAQSALIPYLKPEVYGRSILENSSFILSSLNPDRENHGRGYIARLSGASAEFLSIWAYLAFGPRPFRLQGSELVYAPQPVLRGDFFTEEPQKVVVQAGPTQTQVVSIPANAFAYRFLGSTLVVYHNPDRRDTFGPDRVHIQSFRLLDAEGKTIETAGSIVPLPLSTQIREGAFPRIDVFFGKID